MKINARYTVFILIFLLLAGKNLQAQQSEDRKVRQFEGVKVSQGIDVELVRGNGSKVHVESDNIPLDKIVTEVDDNILKIYLESGRYRNSDVKVTVYFNSLDLLAASSAGNIYSKDLIKSNELSIMVSSAGSVDVEIETSKLKVDVSSSGDVDVKGHTDQLDIEASSAGDVDAYELKANDVDVRASSAGDVKVYAVESITAKASSGADIRFKGNPQKSQTGSSSGGSVRKTD